MLGRIIAVSLSVGFLSERPDFTWLSLHSLVIIFRERGLSNPSQLLAPSLLVCAPAQLIGSISHGIGR